MRMILDNYKNDLQSNEDYLIILKENVNTLSYEEMLKSFNDLINERKLK
jgi:RNase P protein component